MPVAASAERWHTQDGGKKPRTEQVFTVYQGIYCTAWLSSCHGRTLVEVFFPELTERRLKGGVRLGRTT